MAGSQTKSKQGSKRSKRKAPSRTRSRAPSAADHAREAASEWGRALRYGAAALAPLPGQAIQATKAAALRRVGGGDGTSLAERLNPATTEKGGRAGDVADVLLAKLGLPGKLASKASLGSRAIERMAPSDGDMEEAEPDEERPDAPDADEPEGEHADEAAPGPEDDEAEEPVAEREEADAEAGPDDEYDESDIEAQSEGEYDEYLEDEPEHAYSDVIARYRRPPNAYTGTRD